MSLFGSLIDNIIGREDQAQKKRLEADNARIEREMAPLRQAANQRLLAQRNTLQPQQFQARQQNIMQNGDQQPLVRRLSDVNLKQGLTAGFRNIFDSNSPVDQMNRAGEGRAVSYRQSELDRGNKRPYENIGQQLIGNSARLVNTVGQAAQTLPLNFRIQAAQATGNMSALDNALKDSESYNRNLSSGRGGILNAGNFLYNNEQDLNMSTSEALKRSALNTVGTASELLPYKINVLKGAKFATRAAANAGVDALLGTGESAARQYMQTGRIDPTQLVADSVGNAVMGVVPSAVGQVRKIAMTPKGLNQLQLAERNKWASIFTKANDEGKRAAMDFAARKIDAIDRLGSSPVDKAVSKFVKPVAAYDEGKYTGAIGKGDTNPLESLKQEAKPFVIPKTNSTDVTKLSAKDLEYYGKQGYTSITDKYGKTREIAPVKSDGVQRLDSLNPTGGVFVDYNPKTRATMPLADNMTTYDKTAGKAPDELVTIYRGAPKNQKGIVAGDFITTNRELAKSYTGDGNVLEMQVPASHILDDKTSPLGEEYLYRPTQSQPPKSPQVDADEAFRQELRAQGMTVPDDYVQNKPTVTMDNLDLKRLKTDVEYQREVNDSMFAVGQPTKEALMKEYKKAFGNYDKPKQSPLTVEKKPTLQDALEGKSTKLKVTSSDSSLATSPELSVSSPRSSGLETSPGMQQIGKTKLEIEKNNPSQSLANNTTKTREVKLNTDRLNPDSGYAGLAEMNKRTTEVVDTLSNKEVQSLAKDAGIDTVTHSPEQIKKKIAEQLNVRQDAVRYMNEAEVARKAGNLDLAEQSMMKAAEAGRISRSQGSELGQQLQARKIIANQLDTPQQRIFKLLDNAGINPETYVNRLRDVDFTNAKQVVEAYRDLVPAKGKDWVDVVRYNSMLSSPLTHMVNAMSNSINVGVVAPLEKTLRGVSDAVGGLFGKERKYAAGEGIAYLTGGAKSIKKAADEFMNVLSGKSQMQNLDLNEYSTPLATKGVSGATYKTLSVPTKLLGASDKFFRTLAEAGEENALKLRQKKGIKVRGDVKALAEAEGSYRLYQQDTDLKGQGAILSTVDSLTNSIMQLRNKHMVFKFVFPFVKTPSNILKQGIEFSPLGFANLAKNSDKATALTRAAIGTAVFGTAASMIAAGDMTWGEPTNADARDRFRAEGKQPYAIRIGGKWIAFNKLPPAFSYPMALTAGIHDAVTNGDMTEDTGSRIFEGIAKYGQFLSDQSYAKNIGDTLNAFKGDPDKAVQAIANYPQQVIPFRALTGWIARMSDNTERRIKTDKEGVAGEIDKQVQALMQQYPFLRQKTGTRDYEGTPIPSNNPVLNGFSPLKITDDRGTSELDTIRDQYKTQQKSEKAIKESLKTDEESGTVDTSNANYKVDSDGKVYANIDGEVKTFETKELYDKAIKKVEKQKQVDDFLDGNEKMKEIDGKIYLKSDDTESGYTTINKVEWEYDKASKGLDMAIDKAKTANDLDSWKSAAEKKYDALSKKRDSYDPDTEFDKIDTVEKQMLNLEQEYSKYASNGYIKKPKTGKGKNGNSKYEFDLGSYSLLPSGSSSVGAVSNLLNNARVSYRG